MATILLGLLHGLHVLGAVLWIGPLFMFGHVLMPAMQEMDPVTRVRVAGAVIHRLSRLGWISLFLLAATGLFLLFHHPFSLFTYLGRMILLKLMIVGIMIGAFAYGHAGLFGDYQKFLPRLDEGLSPDDSAKVVRFLDDLRISIGRWYRFVAYCGILVVLLIEIGIFLG